MKQLSPNAPILDKVAFILKVATELGLFQPRMFDILMDKHDHTPKYVDFMIDSLSTQIWDQISLDIQIEEFEILMKFDNFYDYFNHTAKQYRDYQLNN